VQNRLGPWIITIYAVLLVLVGCSTPEVTPPTPAQLVSLSVSPANSSIAPGTTVQMTATGTFADNSKRNVTASVTWNSSDLGIADVSNAPGSQGLATAMTMTGSTVISAVSGGITGTTTLTTSHVSSITVTPVSPPCIAPGTTQQFTATGTLVDSTQQNLTSFATWTSLNLGIAIVNDTAGSKGLATALAPGTASIQATYDSKDGLASLTSSAVASIVTSPTSTSIPKGTKQQFTVMGTLSGNCNTQDVTSLATWTTSNIAVATVSDTLGSKGLATAVDIGTATITATIDSIPSSSATLTVTQAVLESIEVTPSNQNIALGQTQQFIATGTFSDGTTLDLTSSVTWDSSDTGIATINNTTGTRGLATSHSEGTATITATVSGITSKPASLTVTAPVLVSIIVTPSNPTIFAGMIKQFFATGSFSDNTTQDLTSTATWESSNSTTVAFISNSPGSQGLATSFSAGVTTITAKFGTISGTTVLTVTF
jgi:uncharacterized lipoprotein NlpE involved in copper resistance